MLRPFFAKISHPKKLVQMTTGFLGTGRFGFGMKRSNQQLTAQDKSETPVDTNGSGASPQSLEHSHLPRRFDPMAQVNAMNKPY